MELLRKLGQRETWLELSGIGIGIFTAVGVQQGWFDGQPDAPMFLAAIVAALVGPVAPLSVYHVCSAGKYRYRFCLLRATTHCSDSSDAELSTNASFEG